MGECQYTTEDFNAAFLASTPEISQEILDYSFQFPMWMAVVWALKEWTSNQNVMQQLIFRGSVPEIERGFDKWKQMASAAGCQPCAADCSYNWTTFHGHGMERRLVQLMRREFKTPKYCVSSITSSYEYETIFAKIIENINLQVSFFKEFNIGLNFLTGIAKKLIMDGNGLQANTADPYQYRLPGNATLGKLNRRGLVKLYEGLRRRVDAVPFDMMDGKPIYALSASDELIDDLFINDATSRQDLRFSSAADAVLNKYNFMSSIFGMFINAPILYPRRFDLVVAAAVGTQTWVERLPFMSGLPTEVGEFSDLNPAWENAGYEEVLIHGKNPFAVFYRAPVTSIGQGTEFGPAPTFMNSWQWVNIQTEGDVFRREGFFATEAEIALSAQWSGSVYGWLVPRPSKKLTAEYYPAPTCPEKDVDCKNTVPPVCCPCPLILGAVLNPITGHYLVSFAVPIVGKPTFSIILGLNTGGYIVGTVTALSSDGKIADITFEEKIDFTNCVKFTSVFCTDTLACTSMVLDTCDCRSGETGNFRVILETPIKATTITDVVYGCMGDGTVQHFSVVGVDMLTNTWTIEYAAGYGPTDDPNGDGGSELEEDINCDRNGIVSICVPPGTDSTCPTCSCGNALVVTQCEDTCS